MAASPDAVLHLAALHTLASAGFASTSRAASMTLSSVMARYLHLVATSCTERAHLAGRTKVAAVDIVDALDDLGVGGITELQEWTLDLDKEVVFAGGKLDELAGSLRDGLPITEGVDRFYVPVESDDEDDYRDETELHVKEEDEERPASTSNRLMIESGKPSSPQAMESGKQSPQRTASPVKTGSPSPVAIGSPGKIASPAKIDSPVVDGPTADGSAGKETESPAKEDGSTTADKLTNTERFNRTQGDVQVDRARTHSPIKVGSPLRPSSPAKSEAAAPVDGSPVKLQDLLKSRSPAAANTAATKPNDASDPDAAPKPSTSDADAVPKPSTLDADTVPQPSTLDADAVPKPSTLDADTVPQPSTSDADAVRKSSTSSAEAAPKPSTSDADADGDIKMEDSEEVALATNKQDGALVTAKQDDVSVEAKQEDASATSKPQDGLPESSPDGLPTENGVMVVREDKSTDEQKESLMDIEYDNKDGVDAKKDGLDAIKEGEDAKMAGEDAKMEGEDATTTVESKTAIHQQDSPMDVDDVKEANKVGKEAKTDGQVTKTTDEQDTADVKKISGADSDDDKKIDHQDADNKKMDLKRERDSKDSDVDSAMDVDDLPGRPASPQLPTPPPSPPYLRVNYRPRSPDMSWLPPLPTAEVQTVSAAGADVGDTVPAPQSIVDRYRLPVAFRTSQLAEAHTFMDPPKPSRRPSPPPAPSSFPSLVTTYEAVLNEPSTGLRQTDGRRQAADLLRLTVGNPDRFSTRDTLAQPLPPPQISPIVPSHSDVLPPRLIPVNPNQTGVISSILHQIRTPYLPPTLRERLTSLRPPQAQTNDAGPVLYGEPVRGADDAALAKARGKATGEESTALLRATWDSGPKGQEKWSRGRLPSGRKVTKAVEGASAPRETTGAKALRLKIADRLPGLADPGTPVFSPATTLKLRLGNAPKIQTPTVDRRRHSALASSPPITALSPTKRRSASPKKNGSPIKQEAMQVD